MQERLSWSTEILTIDSRRGRSNCPGLEPFELPFTTLRTPHPGI